MEGMLAILMVFGIPITAILSHTYLKAKKISAGIGMNNAERAALARLQQENNELRQRLENIETIVSDINIDLLKSAKNDKFLK